MLSDAEHEACLERYARLLVEHALSLRRGQRLDVCAEQIHRDFALRVGEVAYSAGAGQVCYRLIDPQITAQLIRHGGPEQITRYQLEKQTWLHDVVRTGAALLLLDGKSDPQLMPELGHAHPRNHHLYASEASAVDLEFTRRALDQRLCPSTMAVCPTPAWARQVFPELPEQEALRRLWRLLFHWTHSDRDDALERAAAEAEHRAARRAALDALGVREVRVTGGGNDLRVGFSAEIRWRSAACVTTAGQHYLTNVPSFEVFTTPDRRLTRGRLVASRPVRFPCGAWVEGLALGFRDGRVVDFEAGRGAEVCSRWLDVDDGARYLGELALVGEDSPIARCGRTFEHPLLDENAAAHVALGRGYAAAVGDGAPLSAEARPAEARPAEALDAAGCNRSAIHVDIPFGSPRVDVAAVAGTQKGPGERVVGLLESGSWAESLRSKRPAAAWWAEARLTA